MGDGVNRLSISSGVSIPFCCFPIGGSPKCTTEAVNAAVVADIGRGASAVRSRLAGEVRTPAKEPSVVTGEQGACAPGSERRRRCC
jgi:hypothetical protein